jgi:hypothetical protein
MSTKGKKLQSKIQEVGNKPVQPPNAVTMEQIQNTLFRLVQKNEELEAKIAQLKQVDEVKNNILDCFLEPTWRQGNLQLKEDIFDSSSEEEPAEKESEPEEQETQ